MRRSTMGRRDAVGECKRSALHRSADLEAVVEVDYWVTGLSVPSNNMMTTNESAYGLLV